MPRSRWGFDSPSPHHDTSRTSGRARGLQNRGSGSDSRPALHPCPRRPTEGRPSSKRLGAGSTPAGGSTIFPHARTPRGVAQPGKSACLGDRRSPVRIRPPRPLLSAFQPSRPHLLDGLGNRTLTPATRVRIPLGTPGRLAGLFTFPEVRAPAAEPTNTHPGRRDLSRAGPTSPCPGGQAPCYERGPRGSTPRREAQVCRSPQSWRHQAQASEACRSGFDSRPGRRREERLQARLMTSRP
jgi:hypothetical protein